MVSDTSRVRSSVKRRRNGVNGDGGVYFGNLELNDLLPSVEGLRRFKIRLEILTRVENGRFSAKQLVEVLAFDVLAAHQAVDGDTKGKRHHGGARNAPSAFPKRAPDSAACALIEVTIGGLAVLLALLAIVHDEL